MMDKAFALLEAINASGSTAQPESKEWVDAFVTVSWVTKTQRGMALTAAGQDAYLRLAREQRDAEGRRKLFAFRH
jgi:hypothetical protein